MPKVMEYFGELTFSKAVMREKLSREVYEKLLDTIQSGNALDESIAGDVAHAMKEWAISKGATHFTHWFQPQRGGTAEKHDAFLTYSDQGDLIERFSAKQLIQSEPDASSFPSGGIRSTFEARGYTAWDPTSPAFLHETGETRTLVIPTVFLSWTGEVLDQKTPFLRSMRALNDAGIKLQRLLGNRLARKIVVNAGPEQEYFVVARRLAETRPDLRICGRTLFGAAPAKGQQMEDHYFGSIHPKMMRFMEDLDRELYRRGIPAKTRHNEVSPNQFEIAPLYEEANLAIDHNLLMMDIMKKVGYRHDLEVLLHEKPFAGVNGSGKHVNWSIGDNTGANYLEPSASPLKNVNFLLTLGALLLGLDKFGGLLRAVVADAGNDHRLGANEAPPAIMSVYLGEYLTKLIDEIAGMGKVTEQAVNHISMGVRNLPRVAKDYSDRNRTSPIAFTGNKFEFRAVGSSQNPSEAMTVLNLLVAYGYYIIETRMSELSSIEEVKERAITVLKGVFEETRRVRFEGNGYSEEWHREAAARGLPNARNTPAALDAYLEKEVIELMARSRTLSERELRAKVEIKLETYNKTKEIEFKTATNMARTLYLPALTKQIAASASAAGAMKQAGLDSSVLLEEAKRFESLFAEIRARAADLEAILQEAAAEKNHHQRAFFLAERGEAALGRLRAAVDTAEELVAAEFWPVAKYQELLTVL
ncbi:MAG: Glutamine synthetase type III, GlnN [Candidatus Ozemobacter sibiricus]|uniref:Glutamine synthetase type III, GlnN n=1 Tax=Candidatus Ozemobacter sibiricus TaxID=2268124 RepID=A0A367ZJM9_9BACT|nr:MAG: Glutamine synthetase type III, GlnN [Candidatus Ozemobacter sibiricus]